MHKKDIEKIIYIKEILRDNLNEVLRIDFTNIDNSNINAAINYIRLIDDNYNISISIRGDSYITSFFAGQLLSLNNRLSKKRKKLDISVYNNEGLEMVFKYLKFDVLLNVIFFDADGNKKEKI
jgi:poly(A) polymerase Pap1